MKKSRLIEHTDNLIRNSFVVLPANFRGDLYITIVEALDAKGTAVTIYLAGNRRSDLRTGSIPVQVFVAIAARCCRCNSKCPVHLVDTGGVCCCSDASIDLRSKYVSRSLNQFSIIDILQCFTKHFIGNTITPQKVGESQHSETNLAICA